jgi:hypothetical protein
MTKLDGDDLVPRSELGEREDQFDSLVHERDEARAQLDGAMRQVAALREALNWAMAYAGPDADRIALLREEPHDGPHRLKVRQARAALTDPIEAASEYQRVPEWRRLKQGMVQFDKWIMVGMKSDDSPTGWWEAPAKIYGLTGRDEEPSMLAFVQHYNGEQPARVYATHWRPYLAAAPKPEAGEGTE